MALTLTSDIDFRIVVSGAYLLLFEVGIPNLVCVHASWDGEVSRTIFR